jgi:NDP-sugar pyrophosphorylase family protein
MRHSGLNIPKPLVPALGVPLLERNVHALLRAGVGKIIVAVPAGNHELAEFVRRRLSELAGAAGAEVSCFVEVAPLGNIGCAGLFRSQTDDLLVVYADNLTTLDLRAVSAEHLDSGADITIAIHKQPFRMPFGEVRTEGADVREYVEKPTHHFDVCSAVSVLGPAALASLPDDRPTGISNLVQSVINTGGHVRAFPHAAPWIDVNEVASIPRAEALIAAHQQDFDLWSPTPIESCTLLCELAHQRVRLEPPHRPGAFWTLRRLQEDAVDPIMLLDDLDDDAPKIRHFSVQRRYLRDQPRSNDESWWSVADAMSDHTVSPLAKRVIAFAIRDQEAK